MYRSGNWIYNGYYAITHNEVLDYMRGNGKYYWDGDKNIPGPVDAESILEAFYELDKKYKELNVPEVFKKSLVELSYGTPDDLERSANYFELHCVHEKIGRASFNLGPEFISDFMESIGKRCDQEEDILKKANVWGYLVSWNNRLIVDTNIKKGFLKSYSIGQAWANEAFGSLTDKLRMLKGEYKYSVFGTPVDVIKVLHAFYDLDTQNPIANRDSRERLEQPFTALLNGDTDDMYLAARYFVYQLLEEKKNNSSFNLDKKFKDKFLKDLSQKCNENKKQLKKENTVYGENKWQALEELNDTLLNELNFKKGFIEE